MKRNLLNIIDKKSEGGKFYRNAPLAESKKAQNLKSKAVDIIAVNKKKLMHSEDWQHLNLSLVADIIATYMTKVERKYPLYLISAEKRLRAPKYAKAWGKT